MIRDFKESKYKQRVVELLNDYYDRESIEDVVEILLEMISESEAKELCKEMGIPVR